MKQKYSITDNGEEKSKVKKFFQKDFSQMRFIKSLIY